MKKLLAVLAILMLTSTSVFAMASKPPANSLYGCMASVDEAATKSGLKNPWGGGDIKSWMDFTMPKYSACACKYYGRPYQGYSC